jgi:hypothetical protein
MHSLPYIRAAQHCFSICVISSVEVPFKQVLTVFLNTVVSVFMSFDVFGFQPVVVLNFDDWFQRIGMRPCGWRVTFPHSSANAQITLSSVFRNVKFTAFVLYRMKLSFNTFMYFMLPKSIYV